MGILVVDRSGIELALEGEAIVLAQAGQPRRSVPARIVDRIVIRSETRADLRVLAKLAALGVGVTIQAGRRGQQVANLVSGAHGDARIRIGQCRLIGDAAFETMWSRRLVHAKIASQRRLIQQALQIRPDLRKPLFDASQALYDLLLRLPECAGVDFVRGLEGAAASAYFGAFTGLFATSLNFTARRRRPPPDPVNACLSLGYTLLYAETVHACWHTGLDPMVGYLHRPAFGRESMACDLVEPWRARVDAMVWRLFADQTLRADHFGKDGSSACVMNKAGRAIFYQQWANVRAPLARALVRHARIAARMIGGFAGAKDASIGGNLLDTFHDWPEAGE